MKKLNGCLPVKCVMPESNLIFADIASKFSKNVIDSAANKIGKDFIVLFV